MSVPESQEVLQHIDNEVERTFTPDDHRRMHTFACALYKFAERHGQTDLPLGELAEAHGGQFVKHDLTVSIVGIPELNDIVTEMHEREAQGGGS